MEIHGISVEKVKNFTTEEWGKLDSETKKEYELVLDYLGDNVLPDDFIDEQKSPMVFG